MKLLHQHLLTAVGVLSVFAVSARAEMREWTSADGKKLEAEFVGTEGAGASAMVKLKLAIQKRKNAN